MNRLWTLLKNIQARKYVTVYKINEVSTKKSQAYYLSILGWYDIICQDSIS